ncbi:MAG: efflux RND transporter periplasmic adaptor subunit, partial [Nitrospinaceae bacterium]
ARYAMVQAEARLKLAQSELKRIKNLYQQGVVSLDAFDKGQTEADAALAELQEKTEIFKELKAGPRKERIHQEEANMEAAEARMRINQDNIDRATLRAPFDGIVVKKETEIGEWLEQGDPAASLMAIRPVKVEIHLPQALFSLVRMGTKARVILPSPDRPRDGKVFKAKVIEKVASGDPGSRTFPVRLKVQRPKNFLAPGMLVQVELQPGGDKKKLLYVPKDALVRTAKDTSVWVVRQDDKNGSTVARVTVIPGRSMNHWVAIGIKKKQIRPGDWVVVQGNERLKPGARVKIVKRLP